MLQRKYSPAPQYGLLSEDIAASRRMPLRDLVGSIDTERQHGNLSSAIRLFVLDYYQKGTASPNRSFVAADQRHAAH